MMRHHLHMPSYFLGTFTEYPWKENIKSTLVPKLTDEQKKEFKALFD